MKLARTNHRVDRFTAISFCEIHLRDLFTPSGNASKQLLRLSEQDIVFQVNMQVKILLKRLKIPV